jgi:L-fuconolactonase
MIVDAHHHFWRFSAAEFGWIDDRMAAIRRDFLPADLEPEMAAAGVDQVVSVQARQSLEETRWLLDLAARSPFIAGVVGWVPVGRRNSIGAQAARWSTRPAPSGVSTRLPTRGSAAAAST